MGSVTQNKKFRKIDVSGNDIANADIVYSIDGSAFSDISGLDSSLTSSNGKWIQIKTESVNSYRDIEVDHIGVVYRDRMFPK